MVIETTRLAEIELDEVGMVVANDSTRASFSVVSGIWLLALNSGLTPLGR
jgi:hypothetical protein